MRPDADPAIALREDLRARAARLRQQRSGYAVALLFATGDLVMLAVLHGPLAGWVTGGFAFSVALAIVVAKTLAARGADDRAEMYDAIAQVPRERAP